METVTLYATAPSLESARKLSRTLLARRLIACANITPIESAYWWNGKIEEAREVAMFLKTTAELAGAAVEAIVTEHEYDVPCAVVLPHVGASAEYAAWVAAEATGKIGK